MNDKQQVYEAVFRSNSKVINNGGALNESLRYLADNVESFKPAHVAKVNIFALMFGSVGWVVHDILKGDVDPHNYPLLQPFSPILDQFKGKLSYSAEDKSLGNRVRRSLCMLSVPFSVMFGFAVGANVVYGKQMDTFIDNVKKANPDVFEEIANSGDESLKRMTSMAQIAESEDIDVLSRDTAQRYRHARANVGFGALPRLLSLKTFFGFMPLMATYMTSFLNFNQTSVDLPIDAEKADNGKGLGKLLSNFFNIGTNGGTPATLLLKACQHTLDNGLLEINEAELQSLTDKFGREPSEEVKREYISYKVTNDPYLHKYCYAMISQLFHFDSVDQKQEFIKSFEDKVKDFLTSDSLAEMVAKELAKNDRKALTKNIVDAVFKDKDGFSLTHTILKEMGVDFTTPNDGEKHSVSVNGKDVKYRLTIGGNDVMANMSKFMVRAADSVLPVSQAFKFADGITKAIAKPIDGVMRWVDNLIVTNTGMRNGLFFTPDNAAKPPIMRG